MKPYIDHNGTRYEFKATRAAIKDITKLQTRYTNEDGRITDPTGFMEEVAYSLLGRQYDLTVEEIDNILNVYSPDNPMEVYELLGAVIDTLFTPPAEAETSNAFRAEYRKKKAKTAS